MVYCSTDIYFSRNGVKKMAERKLYYPKKLFLTRFLRGDEKYLTEREIFARVRELGAITGEEPFNFLWDHRNQIPESWKGYWGLLVPDEDAGFVRVLFWSSISERWCRGEYGLGSNFGDNYRVLVPCE